MLAGGQHITLGYASPLFRVFGMFWGLGVSWWELSLWVWVDWVDEGARGDREAQLGPNSKRARLGGWDGVWTGTRAILATGRRTEVCLSSEVEW